VIKEKKIVETVISTSWLFTANKENQVLENYSVVIDGGVIVDIIESASVFNIYQASEVYQLTDQLLIPGLINAHSHLAMSLLKGYADDMKLSVWLNNYIWPAEKDLVSPQFVYDGSRLAMAEMLKGGITTFNDMYFYPQATAEVSDEIGMRANIGLVVLDFPTNYASDPQDYLNKGLNFRDTWRDNSLITTSIAPHAPYSVSDESFSMIGTYANQLQMNIHTHLHETEAEISESLQIFNMTPIQRLDSIGILGPNVTAAHCVHLNNADINILEKNQVNIIHNPSSNMKLGSGVSNIKALYEKGLNIGLGSDSSASNNRLDIITEIRSTLLLHKGKNQDAELLKPLDVIKMATINSAKAMGLDGKIGSIEVGKRADITVINLMSIECQPCYDPLSTFVYSADKNSVSHVWVDGVIKVKKHLLLNIDEDELLHNAKLWQTKIKKI
jgi:5-methylthioadenosine/S-adenosylhomocysteine deaminase